MWIHDVEALRPVAVAQHKVDRETIGWYRIFPETQKNIMVASADDRITIP